MSGELPLGVTYEEHLRSYAARKHFKSPAHRSNWMSVAGFSDTVLRYRAPFVEDGADVAAFKEARGRLPGVTVEATDADV